MIERDSLQNVKVSKGATITLAAKVKGEPAPEKAWFYGRIEIKACPSVEIIEKEYSIKLVMHGARRDDTGKPFGSSVMAFVIKHYDLHCRYLHAKGRQRSRTRSSRRRGHCHG